MEDVLVEQSKYDGVVAKGTGVVGRCTNVEVRQCGGSGVYALLGASITLIGKTTVYNNCTNLGSSYGLKVSDVSTIQMVSLTKEIVSFNNGGRKDRKDRNKGKMRAGKASVARVVSDEGADGDGDGDEDGEAPSEEVGLFARIFGLRSKVSVNRRNMKRKREVAGQEDCSRGMQWGIW